MLWIIGAVTVILCVLCSFLGLGGHLLVLWQPFEFLIIVGASIGAFITSNPKTTLAALPPALKELFKGPQYNKQSYTELLTLLYTLFRLSKTKGILALEAHVDQPYESSIFAQFPEFLANQKAVIFLCDYLRMLTMGTDNAHELEALLEEELDTFRAENSFVPVALQQMAEGMPALGIVAAVLGVIHTMGSLTEPPEILGHLIGAALVGTFLGIFLAYGLVGPMAQGLHAIHAFDIKYLECIKAGLLAHLNGYAPSVSVEFARKALYSSMQPSFEEVEQAVSATPSMM